MLSDAFRARVVRSVAQAGLFTALMAMAVQALFGVLFPLRLVNLTILLMVCLGCIYHPSRATGRLFAGCALVAGCAGILIQGANTVAATAALLTLPLLVVLLVESKKVGFYWLVGILLSGSATFLVRQRFIDPLPLEVLAVIVALFFVLLISVYGCYRLVVDHLLDTLALVEQTRQQAERARAAAESANQAKSAFLMTMSHELRTPLNAVMGYSELLLELAEERAVQDDFDDPLKRIHESGTSLLGLIEDILDAAELERGHVELKPSTFSEQGVVQRVVARVTPLLSNHTRLLCHPASPGEAPLLYGDEARVEQMLWTLLANAAKFTPQGSITLTSRREAGWLILSIEDTGIGISAAQQARLFQPFVQGDGTHTREYGGSGLGLAIAKQLSTLMGGDITFESREGLGSCFTLSLPLAAQPADALVASPLATA